MNDSTDNAGITDSTDITQQGNNLCELCGGVITVIWTMAFEEGRPRTLRADPSQFLKMCPGHPHRTAASEWEHLSDEQKYSIRTLQHRMQQHFATEIEAMYLRYPNVRLDYDFTIDAFLREKEGK
jgi:hypothetical protein